MTTWVVAKGCFLAVFSERRYPLVVGLVGPFMAALYSGSFGAVAAGRLLLKSAAIGLWTRVDAFLGVFVGLVFVGLALPQCHIN